MHRTRLASDLEESLALTHWPTWETQWQKSQCTICELLTLCLHSWQVFDKSWVHSEMSRLTLKTSRWVYTQRCRGWPWRPQDGYPSWGLQGQPRHLWVYTHLEVFRVSLDISECTQDLSNTCHECRHKVNNSHMVHCDFCHWVSHVGQCVRANDSSKSLASLVLCIEESAC